MVIAKPKLRTGTRMSLDEFLALGETDGCWELDDGVLHIMGSASRDHQFVQRRLCGYFDDYVDSFERPPAEFYHDMTTILSRELQRAPEPDMVVILSGRTDVTGHVHVEGVPDIVMEILSTDRNRDLIRKRQIYAESGIPEYWVWDLRYDTVTLLELRGGRYVERAALSAGDTLTTPLLPGLEIPLSDIFNHPRRPQRDE